MLEAILRDLLELTQIFRPLMTVPSFVNMLAVMTGWVLTQGRHAVTESLVATGLSGLRHHEAYHRFFSRSRWCADAMGKALFMRVVSTLPKNAPVPIALDDTVAKKKGPKVYGIGTHIDPVHSTRKHRIFCFGHCWVVLAVLVRVPFSTRHWALPVLFRLYRTKKDCKAKRHPYCSKTELAHEMLKIVAGWAGTRRIEVAADSAYCNGTVFGGLPPSFVLFGRMRPDAVLTALPPTKKRTGRRGRPPRRGPRMPSPLKVANNPHWKWEEATMELYGQQRRVAFKTFCAQWYRPFGTQLLRIVVVRCTTGSVPIQVFFSTDPTLSAMEVLQGYARRWNLECTFRDLKQFLGFEDSSARSEKAVKRTAPFVGFVFSILVLWFAQRACTVALVPVRPWYAHKRNLSFEDILRTARSALVPFTDILVARSIAGRLRKMPQPCEDKNGTTGDFSPRKAA
jgi:hypothetical protein